MYRELRVCTSFSLFCKFYYSSNISFRSFHYASREVEMSTHGQKIVARDTYLTLELSVNL